MPTFGLCWYVDRYGEQDFNPTGWNSKQLMKTIIERRFKLLRNKYSSKQMERADKISADGAKRR
jgi:hypothetical protein